MKSRTNKKQKIIKWAKNMQKHLYGTGYTHGTQTQEKIPNIANHQWNITTHPSVK